MKKILLVDDEPNLLAALQRALRKQFQLEIACGPIEGLAMLNNGREFCVVVSDMRMPEMNGVEFLTKVKENAPDIVRMMLTGNADQATAINAINQGHIFRFLNKPCSPESLADALTAGIRQHQLITAEHELLENTLRGSIKVLAEILSLAEPKAFGHAEMIRNNVRQLAEVMKVKDAWQLEVAALLSRIGFVTIPAELALRAEGGYPLSTNEQEMFRRIPAIGGGLLAQIPRLEAVSSILIYQSKCFDGSGQPDDEISGSAIPVGARILKVLCDLAELEGKGKTRSAALEMLRSRTGWYDPMILDILSAPGQLAVMEQRPPTMTARSVTFAQLRISHVLRADVETRDGILIVVSGNRITPALLERLRNFSALSGIKEPLFVDS